MNIKEKKALHIGAEGILCQMEALIEPLKKLFEDARDLEEKKLERIPDELRESDMASEIEDEAYSISDAINSSDEIIDAFDSIRESLEFCAPKV